MRVPSHADDRANFSSYCLLAAISSRDTVIACNSVRRVTERCDMQSSIIYSWNFMNKNICIEFRIVE